MANPTIVGSPSPESSNGTSASLTKIVGLADGDSVVIVLGLVASTSPAITWPAGFELVHSARVDRFAADGYFAVARKHGVIADDVPPSWSIGWSGAFNYSAIAIAIRSGNAAEALADDSDDTATATSQSVVTTPAVGVSDEAMAVAIALGTDDEGTSWGIGGVTVDAANGFTTQMNAQVTDDECGIWVGTKPVAAGSSGGATLNAGNNENWSFWTGSFIDGAMVPVVDGLSRAIYQRSLARVSRYSSPLGRRTFSRNLVRDAVYSRHVSETL